MYRASVTYEASEPEQGSTPVGMSRKSGRLRLPVEGGAGGAQSEAEGGCLVKYVILIHANPHPWGHPTSIYTSPAVTHGEIASNADGAGP